jgi:DNA repair exonuclease SbcCD nuclease subunit
MKFLAISDEHLGSKLYNFPELENDCRVVFTKAIDTAIELGVDYLVSIGDLFDNNKPSSETIDFVSGELRRLRRANIIPLGIAGDHSKPVDGVTWEKIAGFDPINTESEFVGIDYNDNPQHVIDLLNMELNSRPANSVKFIFLHQQVPELFHFISEKKKVSIKDIDFSNQCGSIQAIFLGDIHKRLEMWYHDPVCDRKIFVGYCGSLGVTAADETEKDGMYYWNGDKLEIVEYQLPRKFVTLNITKDNIDNFSPSLYAEYVMSENKPVFLCKYTHEVSDQLDKLQFLYKIGMVKFTRVKLDKNNQEEHINIRSELKTADRIFNVLHELTNGKDDSDIIYNTAVKLLTEDDTAKVLDSLKNEILLQQPK